MKRVRRRSYGAVVFYEENGERWYLLIQRKDTRNPFWGLPKGRPERGESPAATAVRETAEEAGVTGLSIVSEEPISEHYRFKDSERGEVIEKTVEYIIARAPEKRCTPDGVETADCTWLPYEQARKKLAYDAAKNVLDAADRRLQATASGTG